MNGFVTRLVSATFGLTPVTQPLIAPRFAVGADVPGAPARTQPNNYADSDGNEENSEPVGHRVSLAPDLRAGVIAYRDVSSSAPIGGTASEEAVGQTVSMRPDVRGGLTEYRDTFSSASIARISNEGKPNFGINPASEIDASTAGERAGTQAPTKQSPSTSPSTQSRRSETTATDIRPEEPSSLFARWQDSQVRVESQGLAERRAFGTPGQLATNLADSRMKHEVLGESGSPDASSQPVVRVTIGRIEVRAVHQGAPQQPRSIRPSAARLSLDEYLAGQARRTR